MKKYLFLFTLFFISSLLSLNATETRISALGSETSILIDDTNIYTYPSSLIRFCERGIVEYGIYQYSDSLSYFLFLKELGRVGNFGLILNKKGIPSFPSTQSQTKVIQPKNIFGLIYSFSFNEMFTAGLYGNYATATANVDEEGTANDIIDESSVLQGKLGITYFFGDSQHFIELSSGGTQYNFIYEFSDNFTFESNNDLSMDYNGRVFFYMNDFFCLIPYFAYSKIDLSSKERLQGQITPTKIDRITTTKKVGIGSNLMLFDENKIILGLFYNSTIYEQLISPGGYDTTITYDQIPSVVCGLESDIKSWLTVRAGITESLIIQRNESVNGIKSVLTERYSRFNFNAGLGFRFGSLHVDAILNEDTPFTGGYFLSGEENPIFTKVSATYLF
jgi:hypothetical protein